MEWTAEELEEYITSAELLGFGVGIGALPEGFVFDLDGAVAPADA